jgi:hypothetical protein
MLSVLQQPEREKERERERERQRKRKRKRKRERERETILSCHDLRVEKKTKWRSHDINGRTLTAWLGLSSIIWADLLGPLSLPPFSIFDAELAGAKRKISLYK